MCDVLTKLFFLLASLQTLYCVHSWSACESTSRHTRWICVSLDQWVIQWVIFNPQSPKNANTHTHTREVKNGRQAEQADTHTCTSASKHAHTLMQTHFPWTNFHDWAGIVHMYLCVGAAQRTSGNSAVCAALCVLGDCLQNYLSNISARWGRERRTCVPLPQAWFLFISLPFWGEGSLGEPHSVAPSWPLREETRTPQHWFPSFCSDFLEVKRSIGPSIQHPPGLFGFWPAAVGGVGLLNTTVWGRSDGMAKT